MADQQYSEKVPQMDGIVDILPKEDCSEIVKGIQKIEGEENIDKGTIDWSTEIEEREDSGKIGEATLVSISKKNKVKSLEHGIVSVIEKSRINYKIGRVT